MPPLKAGIAIFNNSRRNQVILVILYPEDYAQPGHGERQPPRITYSGDTTHEITPFLLPPCAWPCHDNWLQQHL